jgi:hypothetical protein
MDPQTQFLNQGLLGALNVVQFGIIIFLGRGWLTEKDKRAENVLQISKDRISEQKDWLNLLTNVKESIDTVITILERVKWKEL